MGVKIENGKLTVSAHYGITQNLGDYSSQKASMGLTLEYDAEGDEAALLDAGNKLYDTIIGQAKFAVMANLGIDGEVDADGVMQPKLGQTTQPAPAPQQQTYVQPNPMGGGGAPSSNGGGGNFKPAADTSQCPQFTADLDGKGVATWIDMRGLKEAGTFKPNAADFRNTQNKKHQVWLRDKNGNVKANVAQALAAAGVTV